MGLAGPVGGNVVDGVECGQLLGTPAGKLVGFVHDDDVEVLSLIDQLRGCGDSQSGVILHAEDVEDLPAGLFPVGLHDHAYHGILPLAEDPTDHVGQEDRLPGTGIPVDEVVRRRIVDDLPDEVRLLVGQDLDRAVLDERTGPQLVKRRGLHPAAQVKLILPQGQDHVGGYRFPAFVFDDRVSAGLVDNLVIVSDLAVRIVRIEVGDELALDVVEG